MSCNCEAKIKARNDEISSDQSTRSSSDSSDSSDASEDEDFSPDLFKVDDEHEDFSPELFKVDDNADLPSNIAQSGDDFAHKMSNRYRRSRGRTSGASVGASSPTS